MLSPTSKQIPARDKPARIELLDMLRGFALFGILFTHMSLSFDGGPLYMDENREGWSNIDNALLVFINLFIKGKFYPIFSFLFGIGFYLQIFKGDKNNKNQLLRYAWRLVILGIIAFVHSLIWRGDVLIFYSILGLILLIIRNIPNKYLIILSAIFILNIPGRVFDLPTKLNTETKKSLLQEKIELEKNLAFYKVLKKGSYPALLRANFYEIGSKIAFHMYGRVYIMFGFILLGVYVGKKKILSNPDEIYLLKVFKVSLLVSFLSLMVILLGKVYFSGLFLSYIREIIRDINHCSFSIVYVTGLSLLYVKGIAKNFLIKFIPVGKMALSNYILQSMIGGYIFFGYGLGMIYEFQLWKMVLLTFPIFIFQILVSTIWLRYFNFGPWEWIWRSLTYLKIQPILQKGIKV